MDSKKIQHVRKVTQDYDNRPILRLTEQRDLYGGDLPEDRVTPLEKYNGSGLYTSVKARVIGSRGVFSKTFGTPLKVFQRPRTNNP